MKRLLAILLILALAFCMFVACDGDSDDEVSNDGANSEANDNSSAAESETDKSDNAFAYVFVSGTTTIKMNVEAEPVLSALGEAKSTYKAPSCAFQGDDYYYDYGSFELSAYDNGDGVQIVYSVYLKDDLVETPEGIMIGSDESEVVAAYGADGKLENGSYLYSDGNAKLSIIIKDGTVSAIEYTAIVD